jgi:diacylglycerol kinase family enzyme
MPNLIWRMLSRPGRMARHRHVHPFSGCRELTVRSVDARPLPLQVDGDYIGGVPEATFSVAPRSLTVVA